MKSTSLPIMVYMLTNVDMETGEGTFLMRPKFPINAPWKSYQVYCSNKLRFAIQKEANGKSVLNIGDTYLNTEFACSNQSPKYNDNPFKLVHFIPTGQSDIPEHLLLKLVNEYSEIKHEIHLSGLRYKEYINKTLKPFFFERYVKVANTLTKEEALFPADFEFILP